MALSDTISALGTSIINLVNRKVASYVPPTATDINLGVVKPDGETITIDGNGVISSNGGASRNIGEIVSSTVPLVDAGLHLLDGSLVNGSGIYSDFVSYIADLYEANPNANYFSQAYTEELAFSQPTLSANGTLGGDSFAVSASDSHTSYPTYFAFDNNTSTNWLTNSYSSSQFPVNLIMYNPVAIKVTSFSITNRTGYASAPTAGNVYGSNDNSTYTLIGSFTNNVTSISGNWTIDLSTNTSFYKYYKIEFTNGTFGNNGNLGLSEVKLNAVYQGNSYTAEGAWQKSVTDYGVCGKFVYDSTNNTVRLPKITGIVEGTTDVTALGDLVEAGLPNITGTRVDYFGPTSDSNFSGALYKTTQTTSGNAGSGSATRNIIGFDASRSSSIYGNSNTVQPQAIKVLYYIVVATSTKTAIQVDIDEIATDLNGKADVDGSNMVNSVKKFDGQWVSSSLKVIEVSAIGTYEVDLSNYLPNDGYSYEVYYSIYLDTKSTNSSWIYVNGELAIAGDAYSSTNEEVKSCNGTFIVGSNRIIRYTISEQAPTVKSRLTAYRYRRLGTNQ